MNKAGDAAILVALRLPCDGPAVGGGGGSEFSTFFDFSLISPFFEAIFAHNDTFIFGIDQVEGNGWDL